MITRFDHAIIAARNLDDASRLYNDTLGLDSRYGGRHTGRGTHNAIVRFGLDYLEILSVVDEEELRAAPAKRYRLLDFLAKNEGGLLAYCLATDDIDALAEHFRQTGLDAIGPFEMERTRPDGLTLKWRLLIPGGSAYRQPWPFFIQWDLADAERLSHETSGKHALGVTSVVGIAVVVNDIAEAKVLYSEQLGLRLIAEDDVADLCAQRLRYKLDSFEIDLLAPIGDGPIQRELDSNGAGVYAITMRVKSIEDAINHLHRNGYVTCVPLGYNDLISVEGSEVMGSMLWFTS